MGERLRFRLHIDGAWAEPGNGTSWIVHRPDGWHAASNEEVHGEGWNEAVLTPEPGWSPSAKLAGQLTQIAFQLEGQADVSARPGQALVLESLAAQLHSIVTGLVNDPPATSPAEPTEADRG